MAHYAYGERIGRTAQLKLGCAAIIPDDTGKHIVLTRRTDNGRWCLPGGAMDPGESLEECCRREVWEETGLIVPDSTGFRGYPETRLGKKVDLFDS